jgi:hypothetical protein
MQRYEESYTLRKDFPYPGKENPYDIEFAFAILLT